MKRIFLFLLAVCTLLISSCTSEDSITVERRVKVTVDPSGVVNGWYQGGVDLAAISSGSSLRVQLFIYDSKGNLLSSQTQKSSDYSHTLTFDVELPGNEICKYIVTTDVVNTNKYWDFINVETFANFKIASSEYGKEHIIYAPLILGLKKGELSSYDKNFNIQVESAGSMITVRLKNWNCTEEVKTYYLETNKNIDYITNDIQNDWLYSVTSADTYKWYFMAVDWNSKYSGSIRYLFVLPMQNMSLRFSCHGNDGESYQLSEPFALNINLGEQYLIEYDIEAAQIDISKYK